MKELYIKQPHQKNEAEQKKEYNGIIKCKRRTKRQGT
jgi:hypothetical protein